MLTFIDFCAGIGGFRLGLELAGHKCIGFCEKDKFAVKSYKAMFDTKGEWFADDIATLKSNDIPTADIWCFGFPCQDISVAGKQRGLSGERSGIYHSILSLVKGKKEEVKPTYLLVENVKNLLSVNDGWDFAEVLAAMDEAGYDAIWQVLNSKDFGVPQNRQRVFIIAYLRNRGRREILPISRESSSHIRQIVGGSQGYRLYDPEGVSVALASQSGGAGAKTGLYFINQPAFRNYEASECCQTLKARDYKEPVMAIQKTHGATITVKQDETGTLQAARLDKIPCVMPVLTPERKTKRQNGRRFKSHDEPMFTLTSQDRHGVAIREATKKGFSEAFVGYSINITFPESNTRRGRVGKGMAQTLDTKCMQGTLDAEFRIRRLTPKECWRLQGFPDELFKKASMVNSDSQLYKQAGNAITVPVAYALALSLPESQQNEV